MNTNFRTQKDYFGGYFENKKIFGDYFEKKSFHVYLKKNELF